MIEFYYTSLVEKSSQSTPSNSIGGHISTNTVYTENAITADVQTDSADIALTTAPTSSGYVNIDTEVLSFSSFENTQLSDLSRGIGTGIFPHDNGSSGYILSVDNLFDEKNNSLVQYRCVVLKNTSIALSSLKLFMLQENSNNPQIDIGIEVPKHQKITGSITSITSSTSIKDTSLNGLYESDFLSGSILTILTGTAAGQYVVIDTNSSDGTINFSSAITGLTVGNTYKIDPAPSQRIINGITQPSSNSGLFTGFSGDGGILELDNFLEDSILYIWIKKTLTENKKAEGNTSSTILAGYVPQGITVVSVSITGAFESLWTFSDAVTVVDANGGDFYIDAEVSQSITAVNSTQLQIVFFDPVEGLTTWTITELASVVGVNSDIITPQSGAIT